MTVDVMWVESGRAVARGVEFALDRLQGDDPLREVVIVTPPGSTAGTLRRMLPAARDGRGVAGVRFTTAVDYALELAPPELAARRPITPQLLAAAVRRELAPASCPSELDRVRNHRSTLDALVTVAERLRNIDLAPDPRGVLDQLTQGSSTRRSIARVAARARAALVEAGFRDESTILRAATASLGTEHALPPLVVVFTDCYHPGQLPFLTALLDAASVAKIVAITPQDDDHAALRQLRRLSGVEYPATSRGIAPPTRVVSCPDQDEEVRHTVRGVVGLVTGVGEDEAVPADRIVVLHPPSDGYARRITDELARAGLVWSGPAPGTLAESIAGSCTRLALACLDRCDRSSVFRLLDVAPLWPSRRAGQRATTRWRALCRELKLVTEADWDRAEQALADHQTAMRARFDKGTEPSERDLRTARQFEQLLEIVREIHRARGQLVHATSWAEATKRFLTLLGRHIGNDQWRGDAWGDIPIWQHRAATQVEERIRALSSLDDPAFPVPYSFDDFRQIVTTLIDAPLGRQGDPASGVRVLGLNHGVCLDADVVFVVGVNDGVLPATPSEDLLVRRTMPDQCAEYVESAQWSADRLRRSWAALLNSGLDVRVSHARSDLRRGGDLYPSSWLGSVEAELHPSHAVGLRDARALTPAEEVRRQGIAGAADYELLRRRVLSARSRLQPVPTEFDGQLGAQPELRPDAPGKVHSITAFESLATCGTTYFLRQVLRVDDTVDPAEITTIEARDKGDLIHDTLQRLVDEWLALAPDERPAWLQDDHLLRSRRRAEELVDEHAADLRAQNRLGHEMAWSLDRRMLLQAIGKTLDDEATSLATPVAAEHSFGMGQGDGRGRGGAEIVIPTAHGDLRFRGRIDRIDRTPHGLRVTDFKSTSAAKKLGGTKDPVDGGKKLQLPIYAEVARRDFGSDDESVGARYLYLRRSTSEESELAPDVFDLCVEQLDVLAGRIAEGDLRPGMPHDMWNCSSCSPDSLGLEIVSMRVKAWTPDPDATGPHAGATADEVDR